MAVQFTPSQQDVIDTRDRNILVSAAAGSGKTAVLVERIIQKICDEKHPVDIDRLLIVTFTSAAAAQMRERISKAIAKRLEEQPENEHLQRQAALIHNAQITTIDSFCLFVIRNNFHAIGLDPGFRVADEGELKMMMADVMNNLLEEKFAQKEERFLHFVECYSAGANEKKIEEAIMDLYNFSMSYPFPEEWLRARKDDYTVESLSELQTKDWFIKAMQYKNTVILDCLEQIQNAKDIAGSVGGPDQYMDNFLQDEELLNRLLAVSTYEKAFDAFTYEKFSDLSRKKGTDVEPDLKDMAKNIRNDVKAQVENLKKNLFAFSAEDMLSDMTACKQMVEELVDLTIAFKEGLDQVKRDKNVLDFSDMEHFALQILLEKDEQGNLVLRETARDFQDHFEEIMIDEYQDSNEVQELLLKSISKEENGVYNRFMVGDVKQSIYKFRLARPEIFMEKYDTYVTDCKAPGKVRIDLSKNFRSRVEVTEAANFICGQLIRKSVGNVEYDESAALHVGASYPESGEEINPYVTELLLATSAEEGDDPKEVEALMVARKIRDIVGKLPVRDDVSGEMRSARYSDIVILFRATAGWDEDFRRILSAHQIPVHVTSKTGYFETLEIQNTLHMLRVLDNPTQDIPMLSMMKMPFFGFTEADLVELKCFATEHKDEDAPKHSSLYECVKLFIELGDKAHPLMKKVTHLSETIQLFRRKMAYTPIKELLGELLDYTDYTSYVLALPGGEQRRANMQLLLEKAGDFEKTSFYGLFHFIRYIETIQEREVDFGEANILDENANVVRIMTIHKSKGLEFPVCFVCGLSKQFNLMETRQSIIQDVNLGIGVDYIDPVLRLRRKTFRKNLVALQMKEDARGEDLRVLYVALTRAKEKLIMTGYCEDFSKTIANQLAITMEAGQKLSYSFLMNAKNYYDLVLASFMRHPCMKEWISQAGFSYVDQHLPYQDIPLNVSVWDKSKEITDSIVEEGKSAFLEDALADSAKWKDEALAEEISARLLFHYAHADLEGLTVKSTVSDLKKAAYEEQEEPAKDLLADSLLHAAKEPYIPTFMRQEETVLGTQYGTAVHKIMELLSFSTEYLVEDFTEEVQRHLYGKIKNEIQSWIDQNMVDEQEVSCVNPWKIAGFFKSDLAKRMIQAHSRNELYREQPFVIGLPANRLKPSFPNTETILIQGVIDGFFYENDEIVLMDYKTDRVENAEELVKRYRTQLDYYEQALCQITGKKVKARKIYSFGLEQEIDL